MEHHDDPENKQSVDDEKISQAQSKSSDSGQPPCKQIELSESCDQKMSCQTGETFASSMDSEYGKASCDPTMSCQNADTAACRMDSADGTESLASKDVAPPPVPVASIISKKVSQTSAHTVQVYDPEGGGTTRSFATCLNNWIQKFSPEVVSTPGDIKHTGPLLVLCKNFSRIATDIKDATGELPDMLDKKDVAVIIIHTKQRHALPSIMTSDLLMDEQCQGFGLLVDFAFLANEGGIYDCEMNRKGQHKLEEFLTKRTRRPMDDDKITSPCTEIVSATPANSKSLRRESDSTVVSHAASSSLPSLGYSDCSTNRLTQRQLQIYDPECNATTKAFEADLTSWLGEYKPVLSSSLKDISHDDPLLVLCQNYSRISTDIKTATEGLLDGPDKSKVGIIIIHTKQSHALPSMKTSDVVMDEACLQYGLLVDFAFLKDDGGMYDCGMNSRGKQALKWFLYTHCGKKCTEDDKKKSTKEPKAQLFGQPKSELTKTFLKNMKHFLSHVKEVTKETKLDADREWILICENGSGIAERLASWPNAKFIFVLHNDEKITSNLTLRPGQTTIEVHYNSTYEHILGLLEPYQDRHHKLYSLLQVDTQIDAKENKTCILL